MRRAMKRRLGICGMVVAGLFVVAMALTYRYRVYVSGGSSLIAAVNGIFCVIHFRPPDETTPKITADADWDVLAILWSAGSAPSANSAYLAIKYGRFYLPPRFRSTKWLPSFHRIANSSTFVMPIWLLTLAVAIPSFLIWRRARKLLPDHCLCGYNLTGNVSGKCPECGKKIDG